MEKVSLRPWKMEDVDSLVKHGNNPNVAKNMTDGFPFPYTKEHAIAFIEKVSKQEPCQIFAIDVDGEAVGSIGIHLQSDIYRKNAELGYWLGETYHGKGIMTKMIQEMLFYAFSNFDLLRIYAKPFGSNLGSQKVLEKVGFQLEYRIEQNLIKNEILEDELVYAVRRHTKPTRQLK